MSEKKLGQESVFPNDGKWANGYVEQGMNKRFYAACAAMQGLLANPSMSALINNALGGNTSPEESNEVLIKTVYELADELLKQEND